MEKIRSLETFVPIDMPYLSVPQVYITTLSATLHCTYMELNGQMQRMAKSMALS